MIPRAKRADLVRDARALARDVWPDHILGATGNCALTALALIALAGRRFQHGLALQAGSARWLFVPPDRDDGVSANHFGYSWEGPQAPAVRAALAACVLPEMHVWVGDVATQEIIDPTAGDFPAQAKRIIGVEWHAERPPDFLWCATRDIPDRATYEPSAEATVVAARMLEAGGMVERLARHLRARRVR